MRAAPARPRQHRQRQRRLLDRRMSLLAVVVAVFTTAFSTLAVSANTDIPAQLKELGSRITFAPPVPSTLAPALQSRLKNRSLTSLSPALQHALLWDAGQVYSGNGNSYVDVYVLCGRTMNDVFLSADVVSNIADCPVENCKAFSFTIAKEKCSAAALASHTLCAVVTDTATSGGADSSVSAALAAAPTTSRLWSQDGAITADFAPQMFERPVRASVSSLDDGDSASIRSVFVIAESSVVPRALCSSQPSFVVPCRTVKRDDVDVANRGDEKKWCRPQPQLGVALWYASEMNKTESDGPATSSSNSTSDSTDVNSGTHDTGHSHTVIFVVLALALGLVSCLCVMLLVARCRAARSDGHGGAAELQRQRTQSLPSVAFRREQSYIPMLGRQRSGSAATTSVSVRTGDVRDSVWLAKRTDASSTATTGAAQSRRISELNAAICQQSAVLAALCSDSELLMKRVAYSELQFGALLASGTRGSGGGEVWRGWSQGRAVAIKRAVAAADMTSIPAHIGSSSNNNNTRRSAGNGDSSRADFVLTRSAIEALETLAGEIRVASTLEHPNIVCFVGVSWRALSELCMVSELLAMGDLAHLLASHEAEQLSWCREKLTVAADVANALVYLHSLAPAAMHGDVTSRSVLLTATLEAKLSGSARSLATNGGSGDGGRSSTSTGVSAAEAMRAGSALWTAPEVLRGERHTEKADIYSLGVVLSELDTCLPPYALNDEVVVIGGGEGGDGSGDAGDSVSSGGGAAIDGASRWHLSKRVDVLLPLIAAGKLAPRFSAACPSPVLALAHVCLQQDASARPTAMYVVYTLRSKIHPVL